MSEIIDQPEVTSESTALAELPPKETALDVFSTKDGLEPYLQRIKDEIDAFVPDTKTAKGRAAIASMAFKVAKVKTAIESLGKAVSADLKELPKKVDAERKRTREKLELWQAEVRKPLTDWEAAEEQRVNEHTQAINAIKEMAASVTPATTAETLRTLLSDAEQVEIGPHWQEFEVAAARAKDEAVTSLRSALVTREKHEAEQAELAKLRAEAEERRIQDEKDRIAKEAAERATKEAEAKAQEERDAAAKREADAKAAQERAEREREEAVERQKQAEARAEAEKLAAEERAKQAAETARNAEIKRQADEAARIEAEAKAREADRAHKSGVLCKAKEAIMTTGLTEDQARAVVKLIAAGKVPKVSIAY